MPFELPKLSYSYDALEPVIDAKTMEIHHSKHHAGYTNKLNETLEKHPDLAAKSIEELLTNLEEVPEDIRKSVRNNGGGYYNHKLYWEFMTPGGANTPSNKLKQMIDSTFEGGLTEVKELFCQEAATRFGSGWAWLAADANKDLEILSTANQDSPLSIGLTPILGIDVWEHAYYLNYQNRRPDYIKAWYEIINWDIVSEFYDKI